MYRVLLVDDEILVRDAIRENINWEQLGFELAGDCQNGKEAIAFVDTWPVDVVLTDINMPYVDGIELSRYLYEKYPEVIIIIFSGFSEFDYAQKAIQYNVSEYLLKPVTAMELSQVLKRTCEKLDKLRKEERKMEKLTSTYREYQKNAGLIQSKALSNLVLHSLEPQESLRELSGMGITFHSSHYRVAALDIDIYSDLYEPDMEKQQESALMAFVVFNISGELLKQEGSGLAYQESNHRINLLLWSGQEERVSHQNKNGVPETFLRSSAEICGRIKKEVYKALGMTVSVGLGCCVTGMEELYHSWESAQEALTRRYSGGGDLLLDMESDGARIDETMDFTKLQEELAAAVRDQGSEKALEILDRMTGLMRDHLLDKNRVCLQFMQAARTAADIGRQSGLDSERTRKEQEEAVDRIAKQRSLTGAAEVTKEYLSRVLAKMGELNGSTGKRLAMRAIDYIEKNYADPALSLNEICTYLGVSTSHFSTLFKESTGETFMDVLSRTRMKKAKELLEHTSLKNYEIAERVGYSDPHYFSIVFKKATGRTPTEYAKEKRKSSGV